MVKTLVTGTLEVRVLKAKNLVNKDGMFSGKSDPYALVVLDGKTIGKTKTIDNNLSPVWKERFTSELDGHYESLVVQVWDSNTLKDEFLGEYSFKMAKLNTKGKKHGWFELQQGSHHHKVSGSIRLKIFLKTNKADSFTVKDSAFPQRRDCRVTLYQDAHVGEDSVPEEFAKVAPWIVKNNAFEDIYTAIANAKKFVYITGWSVKPTLSLLRRRDINGGRLTTGELLKMKADEGVCVMVHVWDEKLSTNMGFGMIKMQGLMNTFDEEVRTFFANSKVHTQLSFRDGSATNQFIWTHHQKSVIIDAPFNGNQQKRRVIAFVGGLDVTYGRWDTPAHHLYKSLKLEHANDFHTAWPVTYKVGPREPWHDIHSKVEGEIAYDVLTNFEQRWRKQAAKRSDLLFNVTSDPDIVKYKFRDDPEVWNVQFFRSISSFSATIEGVEKGIQNAYINAIRVAKKFIYLENQYFMGSAPHWATEQNSGCNNQIPFELASRISKSLDEGQQFMVYIVLPMFPEGVPSDTAIQEMLHWQWNSIQCMYLEVASAIKRNKLKTQPTDYLNFYCLGNRDVTAVCENPFTPCEKLISKSKRFMIYVHSKLLIADDEYAIVGSANINERSMAGDRDTEMCIGAYQPNLEVEEEEGGNDDDDDDDDVVANPPGEDNTENFEKSEGGSRGQRHPEFGFIGAVKRFRLSLWAEHTNNFDRAYLQPNTIETSKLINQMAERNWDAYVATEGAVGLQGHLMKYPIKVAKDGTCTPVVEIFPDSDAKVKGCAAMMMADFVTQ